MQRTNTPRPGGSARRALSRREFCRVSAGGGGALLVAVCLPFGGCAVPRPPAAGGAPFTPNAFVRIDPDGRVTIRVARPEIGQGVRTALPLLVADELDADWAAVHIEQGGVDHDAFGDQFAGGSQSVRNGWAPLRHAGAVARTLLIQAAAERWGVAAAACSTARGVVLHDASGRRAAYGTLTAAAARLPVPGEVKLKDASTFTLIGRPTRQRDAPDIVAGRARFGLDARVPGMRYACIERAPVFGARALTVDAVAARALGGVTDVITLEVESLPGFGDNNPRPVSGVAVLATSTWAALNGRRALKVTWSEGASAEDSERRRAECARLAAAAPERVVRNDGDFERAWAGAARTLQAVYEVPLLAHAPMEPMNCLADVRAGRCEVWAPTQNPLAARDVAAAVSGVPPAAVTVHVMRCGGGFGRRFYSDYVAEAVLLSRRSGAPVQVVWTREDDMRHGFYRPASYHAMRGALDAAGRPVAWSQHLVNAQRGEFLAWRLPPGASTFAAGDELGPFDFPAGCIPNLRLAGTAVHGCPVPLGQWRSVEDSTNVFVYQSFIDELAHLAGADPLAYRLADPRRTARAAVLQPHLRHRPPARRARGGGARRGLGQRAAGRPGARHRRLLRQLLLRGDRGRGRGRRHTRGARAAHGGRRGPGDRRQPAGRQRAAGRGGAVRAVGGTQAGDHHRRRPRRAGQLRRLPGPAHAGGAAHRGASGAGRRRAARCRRDRRAADRPRAR